MEPLLAKYSFLGKSLFANISDLQFYSDSQNFQSKNIETYANRYESSLSPKVYEWMIGEDKLTYHLANGK